MRRDKDDPGCVSCLPRVEYLQLLGGGMPITDEEYRRNARKLSECKGEVMAEIKCTTCLKVKPASEFYRDYKKKDGYTAECKVCHDERSRRNKARRKAMMKQETGGNGADMEKGFPHLEMKPVAVTKMAEPVETNEGVFIVVDFSKYPDMFGALAELAKEQFRTVDGQVLACVHQALSKGADHK